MNHKSHNHTTYELKKTYFCNYQIIKPNNNLTKTFCKNKENISTKTYKHESMDKVVLKKNRTFKIDVF